jgi:hypothetical protein
MRSAASNSSRPCPRHARTRKGSSSNASASTYRTADACLQGTLQSGQEQIISIRDGKRGSFKPSKTSTISCGISPASRAARYRAWDARTEVTSVHCAWSYASILSMTV